MSLSLGLVLSRFGIIQTVKWYCPPGPFVGTILTREFLNLGLLMMVPIFFKINLSDDAPISVKLFMHNNGYWPYRYVLNLAKANETEYKHTSIHTWFM